MNVACKQLHLNFDHRECSCPSQTSRFIYYQECLHIDSITSKHILHIESMATKHKIIAVLVFFLFFMVGRLNLRLCDSLAKHFVSTERTLNPKAYVSIVDST